MKRALPDISGAATRLGRDLFDMVLPVTCPACDAPITGPGGLCASCWAGLELVCDPVCDVYGTPMAYDAGEVAVSPRAVRNAPRWSRARGAVVFNETSQHLVHALKYRDRHEVVRTMARMMRHAGRDLLKNTDLIAPVPLHRWRLWSRRYNQSALLGEEIGRLCDIPVKTDLVSRVRNTPSQVGLAGAERGRNVKGAFAVPQAHVSLVHDRRVLLVDDVMTSGSTASECAHALRQAGAAHVDVLTFALVCDVT